MRVASRDSICPVAPQPVRLWPRARAVGAASSATAMLINAKFQPRANLPTGKSIKTTAAFITETDRPLASRVNPILQEANLIHTTGGLRSREIAQI